MQGKGVEGILKKGKEPRIWHGIEMNGMHRNGRDGNGMHDA